jgi:uncharacterized membrane protein YfcA
MSPDGVVVTSLLVLLASFVAGVFGFGFGIVATAGLSLTMDLVHAANVVNVVSPFVTASLFWQLRSHVRWPLVRRIAPWLLAGVALGVLALASLNAPLLVRTLGVLVIAVALWNLSARPLRVPETRLSDAVAGGLSGLFGGAFNSGGPPLIAYVYSRPATPDQMKATLQALFLCSTFSRMAFASAQGVMEPSAWVEALLATPLALAGQWAGHALSTRLPSERFRRLAWVGLLGLGLALAARS